MVYTFYSYKGGVGRSMALANVAALLAKWGRSVLIVDWDLEASGIEKYFLEETPELAEQRRCTPGVVDLVRAHAEGNEIEWTKCLLHAFPFGPEYPVSIISAGQDVPHYVQRLQGLDFEHLFQERGLGTYIEKLRNEWMASYNTVLIDSRTGITDIGGICTIHLPDVLVLLFTTTDTSVNGVIDVMERARDKRKKFPADRNRLVAVPIPARDESLTEYEKAKEWRAKFADRFGEFYEDWLPRDRIATEALEVLSIPYIPYWSFGESLPVVDGTTDPRGLGAAHALLAKLIATDLDWQAVRGTETTPVPLTQTETGLDKGWLTGNITRAEARLNATARRGFMEVSFFSRVPIPEVPQDRLLEAARGATVDFFGRSIGMVPDDDAARPVSVSDGIAAEIEMPDWSDYWSMTKQGSFYSLMHFFEEVNGANTILFDVRIVRTAEALLYCARLHRNLGTSESAWLHVNIRHGGLEHKVISAADARWLATLGTTRPSVEDEVSAEVSFVLASFERDVVDLVEKLCEPLFLLFDFKRFPRKVYEEIVTFFVKGKME